MAKFLSLRSYVPLTVVVAVVVDGFFVENFGSSLPSADMDGIGADV